MSNSIDLMGKKFSRLRVIKRADNNKHGMAMWLCSCECGKEKIIGGYHLREGHTRSCGCLYKENTNRRLSLGLANMRRTIYCYKQNAKNRGLEYNLTEEQFKETTQRSCYYCGIKSDGIKYQNKYYGNYISNGLDRIDNTKGYTINNAVPCCRICNQAKSTLTLQEFKDWVKRLILNYKE